MSSAGQKVFSTANDEITVVLGGGHSETALIQIVGAMTGTVQLQASLDGGTTYVAVRVTNLNSGVAGTDMTAAGLYQAVLAGVLKARVIATALSAGTPTVLIRTQRS